MQGKIMFVLGTAVGYVVGTRAGRQGYEKIKRQANDLWSSPQVQKTVTNVGNLAKDKVPLLGTVLNGSSKSESASSESTPVPGATVNGASGTASSGMSGTAANG